MGQFFSDAKNLLLFKLKPIEQYRYDAITLITIILALGLLRAVHMIPVLGVSKYAIAFSICLTVLQWLTLSQTMKWFLYFNKAPKLPLAPLILLSEALVLPSALFLWFSVEVAAYANLTFRIFSFWMQAFALIRCSNLSLFKVLLGYLCYLPIMVVLLAVLIAWFVGFGWLDFHEIMKAAETLQEQSVR